MPKYVFCPWARPSEGSAEEGSAKPGHIADKIFELTKGWNLEREKKSKVGYILVCWEGVAKRPLIIGRGSRGKRTEDGKILLTDEDQVYIEGHHEEGKGYITAIHAEESGSAYALPPAALARRFEDCFEASSTFTGKIKFYNCSSGVNGGGFVREASR